MIFLETSGIITTVTLHHLFQAAINKPEVETIPHSTPNFRYPTETYSPVYYTTTSAPYQQYLKEPENNFSTFNQQNINSNKNLQCGTRAIPQTVVTGLVLNGLKASRTDFPWLAALFHQKRRFICGGTVVSNRIVLTAAHCVFEKGKHQPFSPYEFTIYMGKYKLYDLNEDGYISSDVHTFIVHPNWKPRELSYDSDIAVAVLSKRIIYSNTIRPICIWTQTVGHYDLVGKRGIVAGRLKNSFLLLL